LGNNWKLLLKGFKTNVFSGLMDIQDTKQLIKSSSPHNKKAVSLSSKMPHINVPYFVKVQMQL